MRMIRLFRHTANLMLWAGALLLTGCQYADMVTDLHNAKRSTDSLVIGFYNGIIDNPVSTRAVTLLSEHLNTMGVWGWQTTSNGEVERLFINQQVTFDPALAKWTYSPLKYWQNKSNYRFYAYAPHSSSVNDVNADIDQETGLISINGVTLRGSNTLNAPDNIVTLGNFSHVADVDWMVDRSGQRLEGTFHSDVPFNMQHILSKLSVKASKAASMTVQDNGTFIRVDSIKIGKFVSQGNFSQKLSQSPSPRDTAQLNINRAEWQLIDTLPRYTIEGAKAVNITDTCAFVIESLLIPQLAEAGQMIDIWYSIGVDDSGFLNRFHYVFPLKDAFAGFLPGCNYVLDITIGPEVITFDSDVAQWDQGDVINIKTQ